MLLYELGRVVATPGALDALGRASQSPVEFLDKHQRGEWGDMDAFDAEANHTALRECDRIFSSYQTRLGETIWIITEGDRSSTCLLLPSEY
jgi:hypothetical protein